ncbi:HK97-gp10 family putative phage morphogenesis protein [Kurthia senegalensis]|uniref:HK97-gp10 family putative phage morphogenesis protein n=1 Tax=Kurthia senegalensis TaxID=1033740 RepID=UPI00028842E3|nr:HK97-gp10 family putative phage morphogenesis protein [Kurthia senegalensis]
MTITRFGSSSLARALKKWSKDIEDEVKRIIVETAAIIQTEARLLAPVDSGYLRQSIEIELLNGGLTAIINVDADYAIYIEYGTGIYATKGNGNKDGWVYFSEKYGEFVFTRGMQAQPFWFPALEVGEKYFKKEMSKLGR